MTIYTFCYRATLHILLARLNIEYFIIVLYDDIYILLQGYITYLLARLNIEYFIIVLYDDIYILLQGYIT